MIRVSWKRKEYTPVCWFLHGALQGRVDESALNGLNGRYGLRIAPGTKHDLKMALVSENWDFRITDDCCDCDSKIGRGDPEAPEVSALAGLIAEACALPGAVTLSFCKTWAGERNKRERAVKLSEADLPRLLADLEPNTLYTVACKT